MPIPNNPDVLIYGGSLAGWSAALKLQRLGKTVALVTPYTHLLEDICKPLALDFDLAQAKTHPLGRVLLDHSKPSALPTLATLKHRAEAELIAKTIPFLFSTHLGELQLSTSPEELSTVKLVTRSGTFQLAFKELIDASPRAWLARGCGAPFTALEPGRDIQWRRLGAVDVSEGLTSVEYMEGATQQTSAIDAWEGQVELEGNDWSSWATFECQARVRSFAEGQQSRASAPIFKEDDALHVGVPACTLEEVDAEHLGRNQLGFWLANCHGGFTHDFQETLRSPEQSLALGEHLAQLLMDASPTGQQGLTASDQIVTRGDLRQVVDPRLNREGCASYSPLDGRVMDVREVDVLVLGGGTGGAPAGISAARQGAKTLVIEMCPELGGVGTQGRIGRYWFGNRVGFTEEIDDATLYPPKKNGRKSVGWDAEKKQQWLLQEILKAGGDVWFGCQMASAIVEGNKLIGAVIATPMGLIAVYAKACVDATGAADLAAAAGASTVSLGQDYLAMQGTGLSPIYPHDPYTNTDYDFIDDNDVLDTTSAYLCARKKFANQYDVSALVNSRERRRIVGDIEVSPMDIRLARTFPDTMVKARSNFDTHGFTIHPSFLIHPPDHSPLFGMVPLRAMLPQGIDGVIVTGLGISAHRDAMPVLRMQGDVQNQGYVAGYAASQTKDGDFRALNLGDLQHYLVDIGILDPELKGAQDNVELDETKVLDHLARLDEEFNGLDRLFYFEQEQQWTLLRRAISDCKDSDLNQRLVFVQGMLGDPQAAEPLRQQLKETEWDEGWNYTGMGQFGRSISPVDGFIMALGRCGGDEDLEVLTQLVDTLPADTEFSHYRALADALTNLGLPQGLPLLESLFERDGVQGHQLIDRSDRLREASDDPEDTIVRNRSLIEIHLAKALVSLDPDHPSGRACLERYANDCRALFSRHATEMLNRMTAV